jgi:hypothetical protein
MLDNRRFARTFSRARIPSAERQAYIVMIFPVVRFEKYLGFVV